MDLRPIGVFDSGLGGLSVLRELWREMPNEQFLFFGDSAHAPYGTKTAEEVRELSCRVAAQLVERGVKALVVACNTATSAAIETLRAAYPDLPVIGVEPALKPAVSHCRRVLVMATPMTLRQQRFHHLLEQYGEGTQVLPLPCPGLVELIERGQLDSPELMSFLADLLAPYRREPVDAVVLGCTHYPFVRAQIAATLGYPVEIFDGGAGTAHQTKRRLLESGLAAPEDAVGSVTIENSRPDEAILALSWKLFHM